jgi:mitochondrial chaperone BCS1
MWASSWLGKLNSGTRSAPFPTAEATYYTGPWHWEINSQLAIAGRFDLDIYVVDTAIMNNSSLGSLFSKLLPKCVVLVEDVDTAGETHRRNTGQTSRGGQKRSDAFQPL